jgi:hypothetical protein
MEISRSNLLLQIKDLQVRQWVAVIACGLIIVLGLAAILSYLTQPALIKQGDYAPFSNKQEYEDFLKDHPALFKKQPKEAHFDFKTSTSPNKQLVIQVYLLQVPIKVGGNSQNNNYITSLKTFQQEAKDWFKQQGEDLNKDYIQWIPDPDKIGVTITPPPMPNK